MRAMRVLRALLVVLALGWAALPAAQAQASCAIDSLTLDFGTVSGGGSTPGQGAVSVTCSANGNASARLCLYIAEGPAGMSGVNPRQMPNVNAGGGAISYTLYSDAARTQVLGPESGGGTPVSQAILTMPPGQRSQTVSMNVYANVSAPTNAAAGAYRAQFPGLTLRYASGSPNSPPANCTQTSTLAPVASFTASASVSNSCVVSVSATDMDFGSRAPLASGNIDATSNITLNCPPNTSWQVGLSDGMNALGAQRRMAGPGGDFVPYELYRDSARTQRWGSTLGTDTYPKPANPGNPTTLTVYGRVPAGQTDVTPGAYTDTVTVTLTY